MIIDTSRITNRPLNTIDTCPRRHQSKYSGRQINKDTWWVTLVPSRFPQLIQTWNKCTEYALYYMTRVWQKLSKSSFRADSPNSLSKFPKQSNSTIFLLSLSGACQEDVAASTSVCHAGLSQVRRLDDARPKLSGRRSSSTVLCENINKRKTSDCVTHNLKETSLFCIAFLIN